MASYRIFVEPETFNAGLKETFRGIANIFDSLGVERASDALSRMSERIEKEKPASMKEPEKAVSRETPKPASAEEEPVKPASVSEEKVEHAPVSKDDTPKDTAKPAPKEAEPDNAPSEKKITIEDITKVIVTKIRMDRRNNQKIEELLQKYGVARVSKLSENQMSDFLADVSAI